MTKPKILVATLLVLLIAAFGFYKFNFEEKENEFYYSGENIQPESYKVFQGSWILENDEFEEGFTLNNDNTASSINMTSLLYKKWRIADGKLVLTAISLGNHRASVSDEEYTINSFNHEKLLLEKDGENYIYKKAKQKIVADTSYNSSLSTAFEYFPVDESNISSSKHLIDFTSNPRASENKAVILELYNDKSINFGGHYIIAEWGCGSGCLEGVMIDARDGKVYNLPTNKGNIDFGNGIENFSNSILLLTSFTQAQYIPNTTNREVEKTYWLWNESAKEFIRYSTSKDIIKE